MSTMVLKPVVVVNFTLEAGVEGVFRATVMLYRFGFPKFHGYHSSGTPFLTRNAAVNLVTLLISPLILSTPIASDEIRSSGIEMVMLGLGSGMAERTNKVTLTIQSAD